VPYEHPDVAALEQAAQQFYVQIYGSPDETPFTTADFTPPHGAFLVGYLNEEAVAMGGWRFRTPGVPRVARRPAEIRRMYVRECVRGRGFARLVLAALEASAQPPALTGCSWRLANHKSQPSVSIARVATSTSSGSGTTRPQRRRSTSAGHCTNVKAWPHRSPSSAGSNMAIIAPCAYVAGDLDPSTLRCAASVHKCCPDRPGVVRLSPGCRLVGKVSAIRLILNACSIMMRIW